MRVRWALDIIDYFYSQGNDSKIMCHTVIYNDVISRGCSLVCLINKLTRYFVELFEEVK